eukprot:6304220-Amphidinium_carterae.2
MAYSIFTCVVQMVFPGKILRSQPTCLISSATYDMSCKQVSKAVEEDETNCHSAALKHAGNKDHGSCWTQRLAGL